MLLDWIAWEKKDNDWLKLLILEFFVALIEFRIYITMTKLNA